MEKNWADSGLGRYFERGARTTATLELLRANEKAWLGDLVHEKKNGRRESSDRTDARSGGSASSG